MANQKKKKHTGAKVTAATAVLLAALAGGSFGIGRGGFTLPRTQPSDTNGVIMEPATVVENSFVPDEKTLNITVRNTEILYQGSTVTLEQLEKSLLSDYKADEKEIVLQDDHAIKAAYDEVTALLAKLSLPYTAE